MPLRAADAPPPMSFAWLANAVDVIRDDVSMVLTSLTEDVAPDDETEGPCPDEADSEEAVFQHLRGLLAADSLAVEKLFLSSATDEEGGLLVDLDL